MEIMSMIGGRDAVADVGITMCWPPVWHFSNTRLRKIEKEPQTFYSPILKRKPLCELPRPPYMWHS